MRFESVNIARVEHIDAPVRLTSREIEERLAPTMKRLKLPRGMLESLTGIVARRLWEPGFQPSDAATLAGKKVLERSGIDPSRVGALISTSVCRDFIEPSVASLVHHRLGLPSNCVNFDLANACLGFLNGMEMVGNMIESGQIDYGLVVDGENSRFVLDSTIERLNASPSTHDDYRRNFATLTLGSGAAAMLLCRADLAPGGHRFVGGVTVAATQHNDLCRGQVDGMETNTKGLLDAGVALAGRTFALGKEELGWSSGSLDELVLHQVSKTHTDKLAGALELDLGKVLRTYPEFGNVGPAAVPIALSKSSESGRLQPGKRVSLMGIGSGLNCYMAEVIW